MAVVQHQGEGRGGLGLDSRQELHRLGRWRAHSSAHGFVPVSRHAGNRHTVIDDVPLVRSIPAPTTNVGSKGCPDAVPDVLLDERRAYRRSQVAHSILDGRSGQVSGERVVDPAVETTLS